jgi:hypothetical protein
MPVRQQIAMSPLRRITSNRSNGWSLRIAFCAGPTLGAAARGRPDRCSEKRLRRKLSGTSGSNPPSSSGESAANCRDWIVDVAPKSDERRGVADESSASAENGAKWYARSDQTPFRTLDVKRRPPVVRQQ